MKEQAKCPGPHDKKMEQCAGMGVTSIKTTAA